MLPGCLRRLQSSNDHLLKLTFQRSEIIAAPAKKKPLHSEGGDWQLGIDLDFAIQRDFHPRSVAFEFHIVPGARLDDCFSSHDLVRGIAVEDEKLAWFRVLVTAADAKMIARSLRIALRPAGDEVSRHLADVIRLRVAEAHGSRPAFMLLEQGGLLRAGALGAFRSLAGMKGIVLADLRDFPQLRDQRRLDRPIPDRDLIQLALEALAEKQLVRRFPGLSGQDRLFRAIEMNSKLLAIANQHSKVPVIRKESGFGFSRIRTFG